MSIHETLEKSRLEQEADERRTAADFAFTEYVGGFETVEDFTEALENGDFRKFVEAQDIGELARIIGYDREIIYEKVEDVIYERVRAQQDDIIFRTDLDEDYQSRYNDMAGLLLP